MILDATFWVTISFFIFIGILVYFKVPQKVIGTLNQNITNIKDQINEAEKLKEDAKNILAEHEKKMFVPLYVLFQDSVSVLVQFSSVSVHLLCSSVTWLPVTSLSALV